MTSAETCPACKATPGEPCHVPISGVDTTGWEHDARILAPVVRDLAATPVPYDWPADAAATIRALYDTDSGRINNRSDQ